MRIWDHKISVAEEELNDRVNDLYGLTKDEVAYYRRELARAGIGTPSPIVLRPHSPDASPSDKAAHSKP